MTVTLTGTMHSQGGLIGGIGWHGVRGSERAKSSNKQVWVVVFFSPHCQEYVFIIRSHRVILFVRGDVMTLAQRDWLLLGFWDSGGVSEQSEGSSSLVFYALIDSFGVS